MTTDHIVRWNALNDVEFITSSKYYRRFKGVSSLEHKINIDYLTHRLDTLGYMFTVGCCNRCYVTKKDDIQK